jgi:hypothetical protein
LSRRCAHHWPGNERAGAAAEVDPAEALVVDRSGEPAVNASVPLEDGAERKPAPRRGAPPARPGNERAGALADVDPRAVPGVAGSDRSTRDGNAPVGDGADDRDEVDRSSFDREAVDPDARDRAGAAGIEILALDTSTAFS